MPASTTASMFRAAAHSAARRARELLLMEGAEQSVLALTPQQQQDIQRHYEAGNRRFVAAEQVSQGQNAVAALILYREAALHFIKALTAARDPDSPVGELTLEAGWQRLATLSAGGQIPPLPPFVISATKILAQPDPMAYDDRPIDELLSWRPDAEAAAAWLRGLVGPRTLQQVRSSRTVRLALTGLVAAAIVAWGVVTLLRPRNLAHGRLVTISERLPKSTAPADNSGLVNGTIEPTYGIHTTGNAAWVMIDLQAVHAIDKVKVFNRADGWTDEGLPLTLEFSHDGKAFTEVGKRTESFTSSHPWVFEAGGRETRFLRLRSGKYLALTEVEVTGLN